MHIYSFEKLVVWKEARDFVKWIYNTTNTFPNEEKYGLISQMKRASISIVSIIAEGSARVGIKEQAYFYQVAYSSLIEVLNQLIISSDLGFINEKQLEKGKGLIDKIAAKLGALRKSRINPKL